MELVFLKSSWSDIIILKNGNDIGIIDTGFYWQFNLIKEYLDNMSIKRISFIILTHFHRDHYGSLDKIVENYIVDRVYFKDYSALDGITCKGEVADSKYRNDEYNKCIKIKNIIEKNSKLILVDNINSIWFGDYELKLYNTNNIVKNIYFDNNYIDLYKKNLLSENENSLVVFMQVNGVNVLFAGDIFDRGSIHKELNYTNYRIASLIGEEIDIYKVPHHGTIYCNSLKTLNIYKPKIAVITNEKDYLINESTICDDLLSVNKACKILLTDESNVAINISTEGNISYTLS